jgi:hypothetical protein
MDEITPPPGREEGKDDPGCAYVLDGPGSKRTCGAPARPASSYCMHHHSLCHIACGSTAEANRLREVEALASAVGGRHARDDGGPSRQFLKRLEQTVRTVPRPSCS